MSAETLSSIYGFLAAATGLALALGTWYFGIHFRKARNKWVYGLRFTLWSTVPVMFIGGGRILRPILGMPDEPFTHFLQALLGVWLIGFVVLFPVGVLLGRRRQKRPG